MKKYWKKFADNSINDLNYLFYSKIGIELLEKETCLVFYTIDVCNYSSEEFLFDKYNFKYWLSYVNDTFVLVDKN